MKKTQDTFCTSFCNLGHRLSDGKPVNHECYMIPPKLLLLERNGYISEKGWQDWTLGNRKTHKGIKI